jgi:hypothetical protein
VAERDYDAKRGKQSHACQQHPCRGLKMSLFLFKCEFPVKDPPEGGKEEPEEHTRDRENRPRCFVHSAEMYACPVVHIPQIATRTSPFREHSRLFEKGRLRRGVLSLPKVAQANPDEPIALLWTQIHSLSQLQCDLR